MVCSVCHYNVPEGAAQCPYCGSPVRQSAAGQPEENAIPGSFSQATGAYPSYPQPEAATGSYAAYQATGTYPVYGQAAEPTGSYAAYQQPTAATGSYAAYQQPTAATGSYAAYQQPTAATGSYAACQQPTAATGSYAAYQQPTAATGSYAAYQQQTYGAPAQTPAAPTYRTGGVPGYGQSDPPRRRRTAPSVSPAETTAALPERWIRSLTDPAGLLREMMASHDPLTYVISCGLMALMAFLCGMFVTYRAVTSGMFAQNLRVWALSASFGGITLLCWMLSAVLKAGVYLVYLCAIKKLAFSMDLALGFLTIPAMPGAAAALLGLILSLIYPLAGLPLFLMATLIGLMQNGAMASAADGVTLEESFRARMLLACIALLVQFLVIVLVGGGMGADGIRELIANLL